MLPQHGGVPNFRLRISGPIIALLVLTLLFGLLITLSLYLNVEPGDVTAKCNATLSLIITLLLAFFILLVGTGRWWHLHLWRHGNSQRQHRHRTRGHNTRHRH